jgi:hypothetical protein
LEQKLNFLQNNRIKDERQKFTQRPVVLRKRRRQVKATANWKSFWFVFFFFVFWLYFKGCAGSLNT